VKRKFIVESYGCQMNVHDAERMAGLLESDGMEPADSVSDADIVVLNTCSVRERAEDKLFTRLGEIREEAGSRRPVVAVTGCVAQQEGRALLGHGSGVSVVVGTQAMKELPALARHALEAPRRTFVDINPYEDVSFPLGVVRRSDPVRAYVTIIEGCNDFCSFCVVPYTRGHERMRPVEQVLAEVREAVATGHREVHLLGQIVNHYAAPDDPACDFAALLERVSGVPGVDRIRFASPHPRHVTARLVDAIAGIDRVCKHIHLPVQSGATGVLERMRRRHTREDYLETISRLRAAVPGIALSTDMIVGFPGETRQDFEQTLSLVREVRFQSMFSFKYSPRPNTLASKRLVDDVPEQEKSRRIVELQSVQRTIQEEILASMMGREVEVLTDSVSKRRTHEVSGRTSTNAIVNFPGDPVWIGRLVRVRIERAGPNSVWGSALHVEGLGAVVQAVAAEAQGGRVHVQVSSHAD
jgi:tRNA-2-methylthio-N6-dimethylallyladenosine synthase